MEAYCRFESTNIKKEYLKTLRENRASMSFALHIKI